ncbi:MAG: DUF433 domain-containing protein [Myxococcota bacterium]
MGHLAVAGCRRGAHVGEHRHRRDQRAALEARGPGCVSSLIRRLCEPRDKRIVGGSRLAVEFILNLLAHGASEDDILEEYHRLERDDIRACLLFAGKMVGDLSFMPRRGVSLRRRSRT